MQYLENSEKLLGKITEIYGEEIIYNRSNSVEGLTTHLDKLIAKVMHIDKKIVSAARQ